MSKKSIALFLLMILFSCSTKNINPNTTSIQLELGKLEKFVDLEKRLNAVEVTRNHYVDISEGIYPYIKNHTFKISKDFMLSPEKGIELRKNYYYTDDNEVKLIFYKWSDVNSAETPKNKFKQIFNNLEKEITSKLGPSSSKNIESKKTKSDDTFRDDIKWQNSEIKVYMFRFGDRQNSFNEINVAVYKD